jgi:PKD repeat protein
MKKRSQIKEYFVYFIIVILAVLIIIYGFKILMSSEQKRRGSILAIFEQAIKADIESLSTKIGSVKKKKYILPPGVDNACFVDLSRKKEVLSSKLIKLYPLIKESIESGSKNNLFLLDRSKDVIRAMYIGDVCLEHYPYMRCDIVTNEQLILLLEGKGTCVIIKDKSKRCTDINLDEDNKTIERIDIDKYYVKLIIPTKTKIDFKGSEHKICIEPINLTSNKSISESYALRPLNTTFDKDALITLKYYDELIPSGVKESKIKINYFNYSVNRWGRLNTVDVDINKNRVTAQLRNLVPVAAFLPEAPVAIISSPNDEEVFYINDTVMFDASESFDLDNDPLTYNWSFGDSMTSNKIKVNHSYTNPGYYNIKLLVKDDKGNEDVDSLNIFIITRNAHNVDRYANNPLFMVSDDESFSNMAKLIPLTMWNNGTSIIKYPYLIYHKEQGSAQDFINKLSVYNYGEIRVLGDFPAELSGISNVESEDFADYLSYWDINSLDYSVVLDSTNINAAVISGLFASFLKSPLIFINNTNYNTFSNLILDKKVYIIDSIDSEAYNFIYANANSTIYYTSQKLRTDHTVNPYNNLTAKIII